VNPLVKYSLARLGLFLAVAAVLIVLPIGLSLLLRLAIAVVVSMALSFVLLRTLRDDVANQLAASAQQRNARREQLRSALAGDGDDGADDGGRPARPQP